VVPVLISGSSMSVDKRVSLVAVPSPNRPSEDRSMDSREVGRTARLLVDSSL
jgi:hypothetical protein